MPTANAATAIRAISFQLGHDLQHIDARLAGGEVLEDAQDEARAVAPPLMAMRTEVRGEGDEPWANILQEARKSSCAGVTRAGATDIRAALPTDPKTDGSWLRGDGHGLVGELEGDAAGHPGTGACDRPVRSAAVLPRPALACHVVDV